MPRFKQISIFKACVIGIAAGGSAWLIRSGVDYVGSFRIYLTTLAPAIFVLPVFGMIGGLIAGWIVEKISPDSTGSGIPQVKAALARSHAILNIKVALAKLFGGIISIGSGLFMGREGPTVHVAAALASSLNRWFPSPTIKRKQLVAAGAGAGLAAAFNAPLAGVFFVLEELLKDISSPTISIAVLGCFVASVVSKALNAGHKHITDTMQAIQTSFSVIDIPFYLILGVLAGLLGALFNHGIIIFLGLYKRLKISTTAKVGLAGLLSGLLIALMPSGFYDYAELRGLIVSSNVDITTTCIAFAIFSLLTFIAYGSGAPGGLFAPALTIGASLGFMSGYLEKLVLGSAPLDTFALVGMGAFFSAVARVPITAIVIIFEMAANFSLTLPLMFVCIISSAVADVVYKGSIYDLLLNLSGLGSDQD